VMAGYASANPPYALAAQLRRWSPKDSYHREGVDVHGKLVGWISRRRIPPHPFVESCS
jgi:hypothetical protein